MDAAPPADPWAFIFTTPIHELPPRLIPALSALDSQVMFFYAFDARPCLTSLDSCSYSSQDTSSRDCAQSRTRRTA